jgi:hypothetical protein
VAHHHGLAHLAVGEHDAHGEDVLEGDEVGTVLGDEDVLGAPALVGRIHFQRRIEAHHLEEVERDAVAARHREDRAAVALLRNEARLLQAPPRGRGLIVEDDRGAAGAGAARLRRGFAEGPGEGIRGLPGRRLLGMGGSREHE